MAIRISLVLDSIFAQNRGEIQVLLMYMSIVLATVRALFQSRSEQAIVELALRQQLASRRSRESVDVSVAYGASRSASEAGKGIADDQEATSTKVIRARSACVAAGRAFESRPGTVT